MKHLFKYSLLVIGVIFFACKKNNTNQVNEITTYQPVTKGTYWKYANAANLTNGTSVRTMTGETETLNGKAYHKFITSFSNGSTQSAYYSQQNGNYFLYDQILGGYEMLYLKENATAGETWTHIAAEAGGYTHRISGKVIAKNITHIVGGKSYNNVIHTQLITQQSATGAEAFTDIQTLNYFIAKGIGIIEANENTGASRIKIMEYSVK